MRPSASSLSFGALLVIVRERLGSLQGRKRPISQSEFAELVEAQQATVSRWESNRDRPSAGSLVRIAEICQQAGMVNITFDYLESLINTNPEVYDHIDPEALRLSDLLSTHTPEFRAAWWDMVFVLYRLVTLLRATDR